MNKIEVSKPVILSTNVKAKWVIESKGRRHLEFNKLD